MSDNLVDQPTLMPTRKVVSFTLASVITGLLLHYFPVLNEIVPVDGSTMAASLNILVAAAVGFLFAYFTRDAANVVIEDDTTE